MTASSISSSAPGASEQGLDGFLDANPWVRRFGPYLSLLALVLVALVLPARERSSAPDFDAAAPIEISQPIADDLAETTPTVPESDPSDAPTFEATPPPAFDGGSFDGGSSSDAPPASFDDAAPPTTDGGFVAPPPPPLDSENPLTIDATAYSTLTGPTGFTEPEFKELRASAALGQDRERSFVRFAGGPADVVAFAVDAEDTAAADIAELQLCRVTTEGWTSKNTTFDAGPQHDPDQCSVGTPDDEFATWTFDLGALGGTEPPDGYALVPVPGGVGTWAVTFLGLAS